MRVRRAVWVGWWPGSGAWWAGCRVRCCESTHEGGRMRAVRTARPSESMSFLFSLERKAAKTLAMHAASSAHTEKSAKRAGRRGGASARVSGRVSGREAGLVGGEAE